MKPSFMDKQEVREYIQYHQERYAIGEIPWEVAVILIGFALLQESLLFEELAF